MLENKVVVSKVAGEEHPADLMTNIFGLADICSRLARIAVWLCE